MKLLAVFVFGLVALAGSKAHSSHHHGSHDQIENTRKHGLNQNQYGDADQADNLNHQINYSHENSNERFLNDQNQQKNKGQNSEYSESNWNIQPRNSNNKKQINQARSQEESQMRLQTGGSFNQQNSEEYDQQQLNKKNQKNQNYGSLFNYFSRYFSTNSADFSSESNSQEDYIKEQNESNDIANDVGRKIAQKMVKMYGIIEKYAAHNGTIQTTQAQVPLTLRQWALPMGHHHFLNMNDSKLYGLNQGIIKAMYIDTEKNCVDLEYFFNHMQVQGNIKASMGPKGSFQLKMANTNVNVSTELENHNRNYAHSRNGKIDISYHNFKESADSQSMNEHIESKYVQFVNRAIESEMIENSYNGLVRCLKSEVESAIDMPTNYNNAGLVIVNKKSQFTVSLLKTKIFNDDQTDNKRKIQYVAFRQNKSENGFKLKVKVVLAKKFSWESEVAAQKAQQHININNVKFQADQIVAYAIMEQDSDYRFNVKDASIQFDGFKCDIGKFDLAKNSNENLAREIGQNLQKIIENGMSAALQQQLYQQQQICKQNTSDCVKCNDQYN